MCAFECCGKIPLVVHTQRSLTPAGGSGLIRLAFMLARIEDVNVYDPLAAAVRMPVVVVRLLSAFGVATHFVGSCDNNKRTRARSHIKTYVPGPDL